MSGWTRCGRTAAAAVEELADKILPAEWRSRADWRQLRELAIREATALVEEADRDLGAARGRAA